MYFVFKVILTVIIVFLAKHGHGNSQCTNGFMNLDTLRELGRVTGGTLSNRDQQQRIIPSIAFRCNGSITKWIVAARWEDGGGRNYFPELQIWRATAITGRYRKISNSTLTATAENANSVYEHTPSFPLPFQEGDILGIFQPSRAASRLRVYYVDNVGPLNYYYDRRFNVNTPPVGTFLIIRLITPTQNDQPLVAVEINTTSGGSNCTSGFVTREAVEAAAAQSLVNRDKQQRIIPHINFTCDGAITKWIVDGRWDNSGMHDWYPDLQIWRRNATNTFTKVGNTTLRIETGSSDMTYYEYSPPTPLSFQTGDVLGIFQPDIERNRLRLYFQSGDGPQNYYETLDSNNIVEPPSDMFVLSAMSQNDLPLISVEISVSLMTTESTSLPVMPPSTPPTFPPTTGLLHTTLIEGSTTSTFIQLSTVVLTSQPVMPPPTPTMFPPATNLPLTTAPMTIVDSPSSSFIQLTSVEPTNPLVTSSLVFSLSSAVTTHAEPTTPTAHSTAMSTTSSHMPTPSPMPSSLPPTVSISPSLQPSATGPSLTTETHILSTISPTDSMQAINPQSRYETVLPTSLHSTQPTPTFSRGNTPSCYPICSSSPPVTGSERSTIVATVLGVLFAVMVGMVAVTVVAVFVYRRKKRKQVVLHHTAMLNPVYEDGTFVAKEKNTLNKVDSQLTWVPSEYEEPVCSTPQYEMITHSSNEYSEAEWGVYVPTEDQRKAHGYENVYAPLKQNVAVDNKMAQESFFTESEIYWAPASNPRDLYAQLSQSKFREIRRQQIQVVEHIGSGQFGTVSKGVWQSPGGAVDVAVKVLHPGSQEEDRVKFLQEAAIMGQFKNLNVIMLHGVVTVGEPIMIVLELMALGDMKQFLVRKRPIPGELVPSSMPQMCLNFCSQIASGMEYLARKAFVHRDLAARNILVAENQVCKIADFGMARDLDDHDYYVSKGGKVPVKWTALEALHFKKYSTASDVWSYGAVMYEIWSLGHKPFEGCSNMEVIRMVGDGYRLPPPPGCPRAVYELMILCWHPQASSRPTFSQLLQALCQPEIELLSWSEEDMRLHPQATVLGAPLEAGKDLYPELQGTYKQTTGHM